MSAGVGIETGTEQSASQSQALLARLPQVRGRYTPDWLLSSVTWFRVGGPAEVAFRPLDEGDLADFLAGRPDDVPLTVLGVGSNLLVRDGGIPGVVIRLGRDFAGIAVDRTDIEAGAAALDSTVATTAASAGIAGLEFLSGIPGSIGGALRMNAGCYGREISDVLVWAEALDSKGRLHRLTPDQMRLAYRHCGVAEDWIFTRARFRGEAGDRNAIAEKMQDIRAKREESQPVKVRTGGSTFANPVGPDGEKLSAWKLIDEAGCRGLTRGGAQISEKHCNFLLNLGGATAADLEGLGEEVRRRVLENSGIELRWEIRRIGIPA